VGVVVDKNPRDRNIVLPVEGDADTEYLLGLRDEIIQFLGEIIGARS
jgi:hypothetical protein